MSSRALLIFISVVLRIAAQEPAKSNPFYNELAPCWQLYNARRLDDAATAFRGVLARAEAAQNRQAEGWAHDALGQIRHDLADYPAARSEYQTALSLYQAAGDRDGTANAQNHLGRIAFIMGDIPLARDYYRQALAAFEQQGSLRSVAQVLGNLESTSDPDSEALNRRVLEIGRQLGDRNLQAEALHRRGDQLFSKGVFDAADELYKQAAVLYEESGNHIAMGRLLTSQGRLQRAHGNERKSIELYRQALRLQRENSDREGAMQSINAMAVAYGLLNDHRTAIELYSQALAMAKETGSPRYIEFAQANLAAAYISVDRNQEAANGLEKLLHDNPRLNFADLRWESLAVAYYNLGRFRDAIDASGKSIAIAQAADHRENLPWPLFERARASEKVGDCDAALLDAQASLQAIEYLRAHLVPDDFMKRGFAERSKESFQIAIRLAVKTDHPVLAWEIAEQARSRAFLDLLAARGSGSEPGLTSPSASGLTSPGHVAPSSFAELQSTARRLNSTLLSYWVAPETTYSWVVSPEGEIHAAAAEISARRLATLTSSVGSVRDSVSRGATRELYTLLIHPVEKWLPGAPATLLTLEPHGPLLMLPFAALRNAEGQYLIERFRLHYVPAVSLLQFTGNRELEAARSSKRFLLIADPARMPALAGGQTLPPLPGARREVSAIARMLPVAQSTVLAGRNASEERVRDLSGQSAVIHFATHGIMRDDRPFDSFLALSASPPASDGRLVARKIYDLDLHASLVFLSACRSGRGEVTGDGIVGLTRAFLSAGTSSIIASLWDVADEPAYRLTSAFYRSWLSGSGKSAALRSAQLRLLHALRAGEVKVHTAEGDVPLHESPVFWAGFVLQGEP